MQYGELITRSFQIVWRHRYLWLLAILGGADLNQAGFNASYSQSTQTAGSYPAQVTQFLHDHLGVILAGVSLAVVFALVYFLLSCVTTGALVRASAEHDAERPFGFGLAWRVGLGRFWSILGLRLLGILIVLVILAVLVLLALFGFLAYQAGQSGALPLL